MFSHTSGNARIFFNLGFLTAFHYLDTMPSKYCCIMLLYVEHYMAISFKSMTIIVKNMQLHTKDKQKW